MAEAVGLIASILTIAETGFKVSKSLIRIADDLAQAGSQLKAIGAEVRALSFVLHELRRRLQRLPEGSQKAVNTAAEVVALARSDIDDIEGLLQSLQTDEERSLRWTKKLKWAFWKKSKVNLRRASLDSIKLTLTMLMHTLDFVENGEISGHLREEIHELVSNSKTTFKTLVRANETDRRMMRFSESVETLESSGSVPTLENGVYEGVEGDVEIGTVSNSLALFSTTSEEYVKSEQPYASQDESEVDFDSTQDMSEHDFIYIAEHLRVRQTIVRFASMVLRPGFTAAELHADSTLPNLPPYPATRDQSAPTASISFSFDMADNEGTNINFRIPNSPNVADVHAEVKRIADYALGHPDKDCVADGQYFLLYESPTDDLYVLHDYRWQKLYESCEEKGLHLRLQLNLSDEYLEELFFYRADKFNRMQLKRPGNYSKREMAICRHVDSYTPDPNSGMLTIRETLESASEVVRRCWERTGMTQAQRLALRNLAAGKDPSEKPQIRFLEP
ncbi:MAG: hypothetical protein M1820_002272 [Bogoriella megaspora]|nr:MAG: hypothetical protein M1820_002272 [Bogoriella megaspora]